MLRNFLALCALGFVTVAVANADPITPGQTITATATTITGTTTQVGFASGSITTATFTAGWTESVLSGDTSNCAGCLDFVYQFTNAGPDDLVELSGGSYATFLTDVGFVEEGGGTDPTPATITRTGSGAAINFTFSAAGEVNPGETSGLLVIKTNATNFTSGLVSLQDDSAGTDTTALAPTTVPEPSSILLFGSGLLGLAGAARRKFAR